MNEQTKVHENWLIELEELELEAVVGGTSPVGDFLLGVSDATGVAGQGTGSTADAVLNAVTTAQYNARLTVATIGKAAYAFEQSSFSNL